MGGMETGGSWASPPLRLGIVGTSTSPPSWGSVGIRDGTGGTWAHRWVQGAGSGVAGSCQVEAGRCLECSQSFGRPRSPLPPPPPLTSEDASCLSELYPDRSYKEPLQGVRSTGLKRWRWWSGCREWSWDAGDGEAGLRLQPCLSFLIPTVPFDHMPSQSHPPTVTWLGVAMTGRFGVETPPFGS